MAKCKHYVEEFDCCAKTSVWVEGLLCTGSCNYRDDVFCEPNCRYFEEKADVVPVWCNDCKHCDHFYPECDRNGNYREAYYCKLIKGDVKPDDYCSYGERKEE